MTVAYSSPDIPSFGDNQKAWLCIASDGETTRAGDTFDETLGESYTWQRSLPHALDMGVGDVIAIWNKKRLLGISWIESIADSVQIREQLRCPDKECKRLDIRERTKKSPRYKCGKCGLETDSPVVEVSEQDVFIASYAAGWSPIDTLVDATECRLMTVNPDTQHSIREIELHLLVELLGRLPALPLRPFYLRRAGHRRSTVRTRIGQGSFREKMRELYSDVCALTGPNHQSALEAAHLYSYAELGIHHEDGGLLMRRDIHRLFDRGLLAISPTDGRIDVHPELAVYPQYAMLHGSPAQVEFNPGTRIWLEKHWAEFR